MHTQNTPIQPRQISRWIRIFPIVFFTGYLTFTVLFFALGPFSFPIDNPISLYLFLTLAHLALFAGYWRAAFRQPQGYSAKWRVPQLVLWSAAASLLLLFPTSRARTGSALPDVLYGIQNPGEAYGMTNSLAGSNSLPLIEYMRILLGPLIGLLLPLTIFYWERLDKRIRLLGISGILGTVALFLAMGTNKAIADTVLLLPWMTFAGYKAGLLHLRPRRILILCLCGGTAFVLFLGFFGAGMLARAGSPVAAGFFPATGSAADTNNFIIRNLGETPTAVVMGLDIYLTSGYYGLSLSLREPFIPMFGVGNSTFLYRQVARVTSDREILRMPYPVRIEKYGWDSQTLWSTIYPWIASDVSFPGTIVIVYLIGRLFALSWIDTLGGKNPFAVVMFSQFLIMLFYFPANNQLVQSGEGFTAFWVTLIVWWHTRPLQPARAQVIAPAV
jgi:hypothetical protein